MKPTSAIAEIPSFVNKIAVNQEDKKCLYDLLRTSNYLFDQNIKLIAFDDPVKSHLVELNKCLPIILLKGIKILAQMQKQEVRKISFGQHVSIEFLETQPNSERKDSVETIEENVRQFSKTLDKAILCSIELNKLLSPPKTKLTCSKVSAIGVAVAGVAIAYFFNFV